MTHAIQAAFGTLYDWFDAPRYQPATGHDCRTDLANDPAAQGLYPMPGVRWRCPTCFQLWDVAVVRQGIGRPHVYRWRPLPARSLWQRLHDYWNGGAA